MSDEMPFEAAHVDVNPVATIDEAPAAQLELLDGDEIVELSIKPSLWFVAIVSARVVLAAAAVAFVVAIAMPGSAALAAAYIVPLMVLAAATRVAVASLQWASRVYVLTNRRVMLLSGVLNVKIAECRLKQIERANLRPEAVQRVLRLGSICITPAGSNAELIVWEHVARAGEIYTKLIRAIKRAQSKP